MFVDWCLTVSQKVNSSFLQRGRIACNAERCNTYTNSVCLCVCLFVCPSVTRWYPIQVNGGSCGFQCEVAKTLQFSDTNCWGATSST